MTPFGTENESDLTQELALELALEQKQSDLTIPLPESSADASGETMLTQDPTGPPGQFYQGHLIDGMKHGRGILHFEAESHGRLVYEGEFFQNKKHGHGILTWPDGRKYEGQFLDDEFHGEGTMAWPDGNKYIG